MHKYPVLVPLLAIATISGVLLYPTKSDADNISPGLKRPDVTYSVEQPNKEYYGNGIASRATEAMALRLEAERDMQAGHCHDALRKARKAAQFDPEVADSHVVLARCMTACLKATGYQDKNLYNECIAEWRLIRWHDANNNNQDEAGKQLAKLRIARAWSKVHPQPVKGLPI